MQDLATKTLKELKALADASFKTAYERGIYHDGDKRQRQTWIDFLERCANTDIDVSEKVPGVEIQAQALTIEAAENSLLDAEPKFGRITYPQPAQKPIAQAAEKYPGVDRVQEPIESKIEPAAFRELTFSEALKVCRSISEALPTKNLKELQMLRLKVLDLTARPGSNCFHGHSKHKSSWIAEIRGELTYLLEIRAIAFPPPIGLGRAVSPGCLEKSWDIPTGVEIQAQALTVEAAKNEPRMSQSAIAQTVQNYTGVTGSNHPWTDADRWNPADFGEVLHKADSNGQLNLLEWDTNEPPEPDDYALLADFQDAYDRWLTTNPINEALAENNEANTTGIGTEPVGAHEIAIVPELPTGCDISSKPDGTCSNSQNEGLGSSKGDRLLEGSGPDSRSSGRVPSHRTPELVSASDAILGYLRDIGHKVPTLQAPNITPQAPNITPKAAFNEERPPNRGDGSKSVLAIGMQVGRKGDRQHAGTILNIYRSKRGKLRAKVQPLNKANFVYFDYDNLIEQKLLYDYEMKPGGFIPTGEVFNKARCESFEVYSRKVRSPAVTNWTPGQLSELSPFKLKQIARDMDIPAIPGTAGKRSLIRAILAEQVISQEKASAQREAMAHKQKSAPTASKKKRAAASPLGNQLSLFDVAV